MNNPTYDRMMRRYTIQKWVESITVCIGFVLFLAACVFFLAWVERPVTSTVLSVRGETALVKYNDRYTRTAENPFEGLEAGDVVKVRRITGYHDADYFEIVEKVSD